MVSSPPLSRNGRAYVAAVIVAGFLVVSHSVYGLVAQPVGFQWFLLAVLTLISGSATVKLPSVPASISISETFVFAAVLLYGPSAGTIIVALDGLVLSFWISKRHQEAYRALFNMSAPAVSAWAASQLFFWLSGIRPLALEAAPLDRVLPALVVFAIAYFSFNSWLIAFAIALEKRVSALLIWRQNFIWLSLNYFCGASVAVLLVGGTRQVDLRFVGVIIPLLLVLYFTFKTSMDRVEDANRHVAKVNRLYLSTIETLALAVDAKDQVTHGHIRRVQRFAVGLAREIGVSDEALLKAIEAAALLHDMGKLAVPEYILNKPGRLSDAEFEKMKLHASVGADILSAIDFPYPVVPIVRHHHEAWDGSGYPDGLRGTDIPIGARILSVVDCFDALTSDRPYRKRLSDEDALQIVHERKGIMYDPWVVETFERIYKDLDAGEFAEPVEHPSEPGTVAEARAISRRPVSDAEQIGLNASTLLEYEVLSIRLRTAVGASLAIFFRYDTELDALVALHICAERRAQFEGLKISLGQGLSGWVAANRQSILSSEAVMDLGEEAGSLGPAMRECLSLPVLIGDQLVGVLSLYSPTPFPNGSDGLAKAMLAEVSEGSNRQERLAPSLALQVAS